MNTQYLDYADYVQLNYSDNGVAYISICQRERGDEFQLLSSGVMEALHCVIEHIKENKVEETTGLVIEFVNGVAGAKIDEIQQLQDHPADEAYQASQLGKAVFAEIESLPFTTICLINGPCLGGGLELALACKKRVAIKQPKTQIGVPEVKLGFIPGWGGTVRLTRLLGIQSALELVTTGKIVDAEKAWKMGLVDEVIDPTDPSNANKYGRLDLGKRLAEIAFGASTKSFHKPVKTQVTKWVLEHNWLGRKILYSKALAAIKAATHGQYPAPLEALKVIFTAAATQSADKAFQAESQAFARLATSQVSKNLVGIFFAQQESKKAPIVDDQMPIRKVGVLGAGTMGRGIAQAAAYAGYEVILFDINQQALESAMKDISALFDGLVAKRKLSREQADQKIACLKATSSYADLSDCDFIIEAIVEKMNVKKSAFAEVEKVVDVAATRGTNTSSLPISEIAQGMLKPANFVGIHFFNPVHKMPLIEIIRGKATSDETLSRAIKFASSLGKTTVVVEDSTGFLVNRILIPYLRESMVLMSEGVPIGDIDKAMKRAGMPMGPAELLDSVGLDIAADVLRVGQAAFGDRFAAPAALAKIEELKLLGMKGGKGIFLYKEGKRAGINPDVLACINRQPKPMVDSAIQDRLMMVMINEAARCVQEKIAVGGVGQVDLAMIFGIGFPPFLGGPLRYADTLGLEVVRQKLEWLYESGAGDNYKPADLLVKMAESGDKFYSK